MSEREDAKKFIDMYDTRCPFKLAEAMGRLVIMTSLAGARGFYQYYLRKHILYVRDGLTEFEQNFVCAHELAHSIYHVDYNAVFLDSRTHFITNKFEAAANRFAIFFSVTDDLAQDLCDVPVWQLAKAWNVNEGIVRYRLHGMQTRFEL